MTNEEVEEKVLADPTSYLKGFVDGQAEARRFTCRFCHLRIDWYTKYRMWLTGRPSGRHLDRKQRATCRAFNNPDVLNRHDPKLT